jgi:nitrite reductase (NADH) large subunit
MTHYVIIGASAAGLSAAHSIRKADAEASLRMISSEGFPYSRIAISKYLEGEIALGAMGIVPKEYFQERRIETLFGTKVASLHPERHTLMLEGGRELPFSKLLIATGSQPVVPRIPGCDKKGVHSFWSLEDTQGILGFLRRKSGCRKAVVIGGGLIGIQAAAALSRVGLKVTILERLTSILPKILDRTSAGIVENRIRQIGVEVLTGVEVRSISGGEEVREVGVAGTCLEADLVILAAGVRPNASLALHAGLAVNEGIVVDEALRTSLPDIYAAGDVAEVFDAVDGRKRVIPTWTNAVEQGRAAGHNMACDGPITSRFLSTNSMHVNGLYCVTLGSSSTEDGDGFHTERVCDPPRDFYRKLVFRGDRLVGAILVGDIRTAGFLRGLIHYRRGTQDLMGAIVAGRSFYDGFFHDRVNRCRGATAMRAR